MRILSVPPLRHGASLSGDELEKLLLTRGAQALIDRQPWSSFRVSPDQISAQVFAAYDRMTLLLCFDVAEEEIRAVHAGLQQQVCEDSCVECFIADEQNERYINFEFNPRGACMAGIGRDRYDRELLAKDMLQKIQIRPSVGGTRGSSGKSWRLLLRIPLDQFPLFSGYAALEGLSLPGNFQKCGDLLQHPHYLTWNHIDAPRPDFHRKECFGRFVFMG